MKKRQLSIKEYQTSKDAYAITIYNARYQKKFADSLKIIFKYFFADEELFFGFYRTDGVNLSVAQQKRLEKEIPALFLKYGNIQVLNEYLAVARIKVTESVCDFVPAIFDYYFETTLFNSKVSWEVFKQHFFNYQAHRLDEMILNDFTDMMFCYFDSGDFSLRFDLNVYKPKKVRGVLEQLFFN